MKGTKRHSRGFTLIASLLMMLLLSGIAIGLMMMVNTEGKVGGVDLQNNLAYHNAEGGIEQMTADLAAAFQNAQSPQPADICALSSHQPVIAGVTWKDYSVTPASGCAAPLQAQFGQIQSGPNQGLWAQLIPVNMLATAAEAGGQEVSMMRTAQVALIPVFQFGIFCDNDCSFFSGPNFDFAGRVHTNGDLYPEVGGGSTLTFHDKLTAYGNVVRAQLANGFPTATNYPGTVLIPTAAQGCDGAKPACRALALNEGSVTGAGGNPPQSSQNSKWPTVSLSNYNSKIIDGNYGNSGGTGAKKLQLPFVSGTTFAYEIIRRPPAGEAPGSSLGQSREYNMAQIRVLLSDDPLELSPGGSADADNVRLANVPGSNQYGITTPVAAAAFPGGVIPAAPGGFSYNTYFAASTQALPDETPCNGTNCGTNAAPTAIGGDWPYVPAAHPAGDNVVPANAPLIANPGGGVPPFALCPPNNVATPPAACALAPASNTYYLANAVQPFPLQANAAKWNLIDGWLRVEYKDSNAVWHAVTNEWLSLGFARGVNPPTAAAPNNVNPNAIIILQQPADRNGDGVDDRVGLAPKCNKTVSGVCTVWNYGRPPEVVSDSVATNGAANTSTSPYYGLTSAGTATQSNSMFNWYPINFYDAREGEVRDNNLNNNTCTAAGMMNAVEIDIGNLKKWLNGTIGASGRSVDFATQNGYVLYFSDRRGMLPNPNKGGVKSGDSGFEDSINAGTAAGTPDGKLDPIAPGKQYSAEDVNQNNLLDNFGGKNVGLGFWNSAAVNINAKINTTATPDPYATTANSPRITSCASTGRKNWVSGARHVLKMVDGGYGNVPVRWDTNPPTGGFTVASENPVYIQGNYNSDNTDPAWGGGADDNTKHAATAIIADSVSFLSNNWSDRTSMTAASTTNPANRPATNTWYRVAIAGGKNMNFPQPGWNGAAQDYGTDGGVHNFLRYLENWGGQTLWYKGSLVSLYYSTYLTGAFKCCTTVYSPPTRNYSFDSDFALPGGLPPGTPLFRDVDNLSYRQLFTTRTY